MTTSNQILSETSLLKPIAQAIVPARTEHFNASAFYQTRTGLYVDNSFADRLDLSARQTVNSAPERPYVVLILKERAYDKDIYKELPAETRLSTMEDIASLIEAQPNGKLGLLLNNGYANIFYVKEKNGKVFIMSVSWDSDDRYWSICGGRLDNRGGSCWFPGIQIICPGVML